MNTQHLHFADLFKHFAFSQQKRLRQRTCKIHRPTDDGRLHRLLSRYYPKPDISSLKKALLDPYIPLGMISRTIFADVVGMRFYINKKRPDLEAALSIELLEWASAFLRIRLDIEMLFDPETITCIPIDDMKHGVPSDQWCTLCGVCCQIGGVPPNPPPGVRYPDHWHRFLAGETVENQQLCPFLFQYFGEPIFFCAIHNIKPIACKQFDRKDCEKRLADKNLHD